MESQVWSSVQGKVSQVIDGRTLLLTLPHMEGREKLCKIYSGSQ